MSVAFVYPQYLWLLLLIPLTIGLALLGRRASTRLRAWLGLSLRGLLLALIVLALAGIQLRLNSDTLTTVFLLDVSDSIPAAQQSSAEAFIRQAVAEMPSGDRAAVVVFGEDALVERLASSEERLQEIASVPVTSRTDIAGALQLGLALFPDEGAKRLVLLSDGRENVGQALEQAELAAIQDIQLMYVSLGDLQEQVEVLVDSLEAPADVREGQDFELTILVQSSGQTGALLRVFGDGDLIHSQEVRLQAGVNRFNVPVQADETGFRRFRAQIVPDADNRLQNNEASAFTVVHGPPRILLVEGTAGESANLSAALEAAGMKVTTIAPENLPATLPELAAYEAVLLANVPEPALPEGAVEALPVYVKDLGKGLVMTGGQDAFGAGGYLRSPIEEALPVEMDVKSKELSANLALVLAVDKSGSMGRCHCDNPDLNQTYTRTEVGQPKVDIAKEAIMRSASALGDQDYLGVVAFDSQAKWAVDVGRLVDPFALEQSIGAVQAEGQTNLTAGVEAAYAALEKVDARRKHIILMTDGWVNTGDLTNLARQMKDEGITLSVVAAGGGAAEYLEGLSMEGGGRYYPAEDILSVPDIFLKETVKSVGQYIIEEAFYPLPSMPSPVLRGLDAASLPALLGYNGTTAKRTARLDLITPRGDPLLASWQYGLGRAAVWTSDVKDQWAGEWLRWDNFSRFAGQLVGWTLPAPQVEGLQAQTSISEGRGLIQLSARDEQERPLNFLDASATIVDPDLESREVSLEQVGPGQYQAQVDVSSPGTYLVRLGVNDGDQSLGQMTLGMVAQYSPEYRAGGANVSLLQELARITGGEALLESGNAFLHNLPAAADAREIWSPLLLAAALLFPLEVAVRRVRLSSRDVRKGAAWVQARLPWRRRSAQTTERPRVLGNLFQARERARTRRKQDEPLELGQVDK
ncbi:MAG: VWA domain-containing protein, partial [Anaerolineales bacterium]